MGWGPLGSVLCGYSLPTRLARDESRSLASSLPPGWRAIWAGGGAGCVGTVGFSKSPRASKPGGRGQFQVFAAAVHTRVHLSACRGGVGGLIGVISCAGVCVCVCVLTAATSALTQLIAALLCQD